MPGTDCSVAGRPGLGRTAGWTRAAARAPFGPPGRPGPWPGWHETRPVDDSGTRPVVETRPVDERSARGGGGFAESPPSSQRGPPRFRAGSNSRAVYLARPYDRPGTERSHLGVRRAGAGPAPGRPGTRGPTCGLMTASADDRQARSPSVMAQGRLRSTRILLLGELSRLLSPTRSESLIRVADPSR